MNALEFVKSVNEFRSTENLAEMPTAEFFSTIEGMYIMSFLSEKVKVLNSQSFELVDFNVISELKKIPSYKGRDFFADMRDLGFTCKITSYHQEESPIKTYLFSC